MFRPLTEETSVHYTTLHYTTLRYTTLHYTTLHYTTLHYVQVQEQDIQWKEEDEAGTFEIFQWLWWFTGEPQNLRTNW